jgi:hypothetical protein
MIKNFFSLPALLIYIVISGIVLFGQVITYAVIEDTVLVWEDTCNLVSDINGSISVSCKGMEVKLNHDSNKNWFLITKAGGTPTVYCKKTTTSIRKYENIECRVS